MSDDADAIRARLLENLDALHALVRPRDEQWANWVRTCRALIGRGDGRGIERFLDGVAESGGLADLDYGADADRVATLVGACHDDAVALQAAV